MTTTSGFSSSARWIAVAPSLASAMTFMSGWPSMSSLSPWRTVTWSSASSTRSGVVWSAMVVRVPVAGRSPSGGRSWCPCPPSIRFRPSRRRAPRAPACRAARIPVPRAPFIVGIEPHAVVLDDEEDRVGASLEDDVDALGARVLGDVGQRFLRDAVERRLDLGGEAIVEQARGVQLGRDADAPRPVLDVVGERGAQAEVVERGRAKLPDELIDVAIELLRDLLERLDEARRGPALSRRPP